MHTELTAADLSNRMRDLTPDQIRPVLGRIWVERIPPPEMSPGGLHIPDSARNENNYCVVRAVAETTEVFKIGQILMVDAYSGNALEFRNRQFLLIDVDQVRAVLDVPVDAPLDNPSESSEE